MVINRSGKKQCLVIQDEMFDYKMHSHIHCLCCLVFVNLLCIVVSIVSVAQLSLAIIKDIFGL